MPNNILITPVSAGVGLMSTGIASLVSPSVAAGYGLGWILQECTISLPLLAVGAAAMSLAGWPLWDIVVDQVGLVSREATLGATCAWIAHFIFRTALIRHRVHRLPGLPHSWIFGHLPVVIREANHLPPDAHAFYLMDRLVEKYNLRGQDCFVLDTYPVTSHTALVIYGADMSRQLTQMPRQFLKHQVFQDLHRIIGKKGLVLLEGQEHKEMRALFNPGLSHQKVMSMLDLIVDEVEVLAAKMSTASNQDSGFVPSFHNHLMSLTLDIIGRIVLGQHLDSQLQGHELSDTVKELESLLRSNFSNFSLGRLDLWRIFRILMAERRAKRYFDRLIRERWQHVDSGSGARDKNSTLDVALQTYRAKLSPEEQIAPLPSHFVDILSDNLKAFIHAGHDTTATAFAHVIFEMCNHPEILEEVRKEHDTILGSQVSLTAEILRKDPNVVLKLPLTFAVIQETLRLHAAVGTVRAGQKGEMLCARDGTLWDTENLQMAPFPWLIHRDSELYPRPREFIPNRWLPDRRPPGFPEVPMNAFRPFEKGRRNCIGQELALLEMRIMAVLLLRRFDFALAYEELDRRLNRKVPQNSNVPRCYIVLIGTGAPCDGMPLFVKERS